MGLNDVAGPAVIVLMVLADPGLLPARHRAAAWRAGRPTPLQRVLPSGELGDDCCPRGDISSVTDHAKTLKYLLQKMRRTLFAL